MPLWAAITKYLVPNLCEGIVRDAAAVLSARSYLREGIAGGIFQKIARDIAIAGIFEGTQLVQLSLIASQLGQLKRTGRRDAEPVDLDRLCDLGTPATAWNPYTSRLRIGDPGGDDLVERWFGPAECRPEEAELGPRAIAALRALEKLSKSAASADFSLARRHCLIHAAACCLQIWRTNRDRLAPEAADGEWLVLCLERLANGSDWAPTSADLAGTVIDWMLGQLERGELFSILPFELAR